MKPESCPRCFAPAGEDGRPDCACAERPDREQDGDTAAQEAPEASEAPEAPERRDVPEGPVAAVAGAETTALVAGSAPLSGSVIDTGGPAAGVAEADGRRGRRGALLAVAAGAVV
ncbi:hypothetical protein JFN87_27730, partial [Streptomyces bomunensis]|nr:hypothetical protein [Streptomyces montanisoli]